MKFKCPGMASEILYQPALTSLYSHVNPAWAYQTLSFPECLFESVSLINPTSSWDSISLPQILPYLTWPTLIALKIHFKAYFRVFLGGPVVKTPHFHCRGRSWFPGLRRPSMPCAWPKGKGCFILQTFPHDLSDNLAILGPIQFSSVQLLSRVQLFATPI